MTHARDPRSNRADRQRPAPAGCFWAEPARLLAGRYPHESVNALVEAGVTLFVDLTEQGELDPYTVRLAGARHLRRPIADMWVTSQAQLIETLDAIDSEIAAGGVVYVHCWGGCGRTGTVVAAWWVRHGADPAAALERYQELCRAYSSRRCPETPEQVALVHSWRPGR